jgi:hypothetical protein
VARYTRDEIVRAFEHYTAVMKATNPKGTDKRPWAELFTEDCVYWDHKNGTFEGRDALYEWYNAVMKTYPANEFVEYIVEWYLVDEKEDRVIAYIQKRMSDPGDGNIYQGPNIAIIKYAGNNLWSYQEDRAAGAGQGCFKRYALQLRVAQRRNGKNGASGGGREFARATPGR